MNKTFNQLKESIRFFNIVERSIGRLCGCLLKYRKIQIIIAILISFPCILSAVQAQGEENIIPLGIGTEADPYRISEPKHLQWMSATVSESSGKYYTLVNAVSIPSDFTSIGDSSSPFAGIFDGTGNTINDLIINNSEQSNIGLFGVIGKNAVVRRVHLKNIIITGKTEIGGLAAINKGMVLKCKVSGKIMGKDVVGGLIGKNEEDGTVLSCVAKTELTADFHVGGIVGFNNGGTISNSISEIKITSRESFNEAPNTYVGGLVGENSGKIVNCHTTGEVQSGGMCIGGFVGYNAENGKILNSYSRCTVSGINDSIGGLVGENYGEIKECIFNGSRVSGGSEERTSWGTGGLVGKVIKGNIENCFVRAKKVMGFHNVGGLVGRMETNTFVENCYAVVEGKDGDVGATGSTGGSTGGLIGLHMGSLFNSYSGGTVAGAGPFSGGLIGLNSGGSLSNCYSDCTVYYGGGDDYRVGWLPGGGLVGGTSGSGLVFECYWNPEGIDHSGYWMTARFWTIFPTPWDPGWYDDWAIDTHKDFKDTRSLKEMQTYENWDFENVWTLDANMNDGYPDLVNCGADVGLITMHKIESVAIANKDEFVDPNEPLLPSTDTSVLNSTSQKPITKGLVADGVTPLLIKITDEDANDESTEYRVTFQKEQGGSVNGGLYSYFNILDGNVYVNKQSFCIQPHKETTNIFAYVGAIRCEDIKFDEGSCEIVCNVVLESLNSISSMWEKIDQLSIRVRKPPVVLIHGFKTDGTWEEDFKNALYDFRPNDFVYQLSYGVDKMTDPADTYINTYYPLIDYGMYNHSLVHILDKTLKDEVEGEYSPWREWAYSKYDVICHSQGGVLTRMLCTKNAVWGGDVKAYRNEDNFYRGRFHRIVTIGSPQNGTSLLHYMLQMRDKSYAFLQAGIIPLFGKDLYQEKFDPWGAQILCINSPTKTVDPTAKFHAVRTLVEELPFAHRVLGLGYRSGALVGKTGSEIVLPLGSDGVVDFESQMAGGTTGSVFPGTVCHAPVYNFFGTSRGQQSDKDLGIYVGNLLDQGTDFGSFILPTKASQNWKKEIDDYVLSASLQIKLDEYSIISIGSGSGLVKFMIKRSASQNNSMIHAAAGSMVNNWFVEVYGPYGVSTEGVTLEENPDDPDSVFVYVDESVVGDVVLYGYYQSEDGSLVYEKPTVVYSNQSVETISSISCVPSTISLNKGDTITPELWIQYSNDTKCRFYVGEDTPLTFTSSSPEVVSVDGTFLRAVGTGSTTITANYQGYICTMEYTVITPVYESNLIEFATEGQTLTLKFTGQLQESSDGKSNWTNVTTESPYTVKLENSKRFYRSQKND